MYIVHGMVHIPVRHYCFNDELKKKEEKKELDWFYIPFSAIEFKNNKVHVILLSSPHCM